jgi:hypothetical protein
MRVAIAVVCLCGTAVADPSRLVRGVVTHAGSATPVAGATILTDRGEIAVSDIDGYFAITVTPADRELTVAANGFVARTVRVPAASAGGVLRVELESASGAEVIEVTGVAPEQTKPLSYQLTADEIRFIPGRTRSAASCCAGRARATPACTSTGSRCRSRSTSAASPRSIPGACSRISR